MTATATVIVVTWNGAHLLPDCLDALLAQRDAPDHEIWVVDNASTDGTTALLAERYPTVRVLTAPRNLGFAGGCNVALRETKTPFVVLVNNDAHAEPDFLHQVLAPFERPDARRVAAVTAKVLLAEPDGSGRQIINSTGTVAARTGASYDRDWLKLDVETNALPDVFAFCGAAAALRTEALNEVGLFDEDLFLYYEDTDLSWRLRARGWTVRYEPSAVVHHLHAASSDERSALFRFYNDRNSLLTFTRYAPTSTAVRVVTRFPLTIVYHGIRELPSLRLTGARVRALAAYLRRLRTALADRRQTWSDATVPRNIVGAALRARRFR